MDEFLKKEDELETEDYKICVLCRSCGEGWEFNNIAEDFFRERNKLAYKMSTPAIERVKADFDGDPLLYIVYDDDNIEGFYDLKLRLYENVDFKYVAGIIDEWIDCHYDILMQMWTNKTFIVIPEWDEN